MPDTTGPGYQVVITCNYRTKYNVRLHGRRKLSKMRYLISTAETVNYKYTVDVYAHCNYTIACVKHMSLTVLQFFFQKFILL